MKRDVKRMFWRFLFPGILAMAFLSGCGAKNGSQMEVEIAEEDLADAMDVCSNGKNYYVAAADKILLYDAKGNPGEAYAFPERVIAQVAYGDALYALDMQNQSILKLGKDGKIEGEHEFDIEFVNLIDFEAVDSDVYLSVGAQDGEEHTYILPWKEQRMEEVVKKGFPMAGGGSLLTYQRGQLIGYEPSDLKEEVYGSLGQGVGTALTSFCVDSYGRYYYCVEQKVVKEEDGMAEYLHYMDTDYDVIAECGDTLLLLKRFERLTLATKAAYVQEYDQMLSLYGTGTTFDMLDGTRRDLKSELESQAGATVNRVSDIGMNQETFLTNLMSGSDKYDIYRINGGDATSFNYVRNHAYVDLSENAEIVKKLERWYSSVVEGCTYKGEIFAVPGGAGIELLYCNEAAYPELAKEDISTWDSFLDVIEKYDKEVQFNKIRLESVLLEQYVATYCDTLDGEYRFDTEAFRKVLQLLRRIENMDIRYYQGEDVPEIFENGELFAFDTMEPYVGEGVKFVPLPSINGEISVSPLRLIYNIVNPNSGQTELAMAYMSLLAECGLYTMKDSAKQYPLLEDIFVNHAKCVFGDFVDYGGALEGYVSGAMTEDEAIQEITELTQRKLNQ
jgi:hypothetical protein